MRYAKLGKTGLEVSAITLGCMSFGEPGTSLSAGGRGVPGGLCLRISSASTGFSAVVT